MPKSTEQKSNEAKYFLAEVGKKFPRVALAIATALGVVTLYLDSIHTANASSDNSDVKWNANAQTIDNGTVPIPTPEVTPSVEQEPLQLGNFNALVKAYDNEGNITPGVVVAFVHSTEGVDPLSEDYDFTQGAVSISPILENSSGASHPEQFSPEGMQAIIVGQQATEHWQSIIDKAEAEGDHATAEYLRTHFGEVQDLQNAEFLVNSYRKGENPREIIVQFTTDANGKQTAKWGYTYPDYRAQDPNSLQEIGVVYGLLEPVSDPSSLITITHGISATFSTVNEPELRVTTEDESMVISAPPVEQFSLMARAANAINAESTFEIGKLEIKAEDQLMIERQKYFEELVAATGGNPEELVTIQSVQAIPVELPVGDRKLSTTINGTPDITPESKFIVSFDNIGKESLKALVTDILPTDSVELKVVNNKIVATNLSSTEHMPTITILNKPDEPHPVPEPEPEQDFFLRAPFVIK